MIWDTVLRVFWLMILVNSGGHSWRNVWCMRVFGMVVVSVRFFSFWVIFGVWFLWVRRMMVCMLVVSGCMVRFVHVRILV